MVGRKTESKIGTCGERSPVRSYDATVAELIDRITDPLIVLNPNCEVTFVNAAASNLIAGILDDDTRSIIGNGVVNLFSPTVSAMLVDIVERCHANHSTIQRRYYWPKLERWYSAHAYPLRDGAALRLHDISDLKLAEERQQEAETRFRTLVERVPSTMYIAAIDELSSTIYLSPQIEMLLGYTTDEWLSNPRSWLDALHPDERDRVIEEITPRSNNDDLHSEYRLRHRDGHFVWVRDQATLVLDDAGNPLHWQGFLLDISEQKRAQENLVELGQKYRLLVDSANDFIIAYGLDARLTFVNCLFLQHFGYTLDEALELTVFDVIHPDDIPRVRGYFEARLRGDEVPGSYQMRAVARDGSVIYIEANTSPILNANGETIGIQAIARDVSERQHAEQRLAESEQRYRSLFYHNPDAVFSLDPRGRCLAANQACEAHHRVPGRRDPHATMVCVHRSRRPAVGVAALCPVSAGRITDL